MTSLSARAKKDRLLRVLERCGGAGQSTRPFDSLSEPIRARIQLEAKLAEGEVPILASYRDESQWLLLTSDQLIAKAPNQQEIRLGWPEVADATIDEKELQAMGKLGMRRLRVIRTDGSVHDLEVEPGPCFIALWNVLRTVAVLGRSGRKAP